MIAQIRYALGVLLVVIAPAGLLFWFVIHPWARQWRTLGPGKAYAIILPPIAALGALLFHYRQLLLGADLGVNVPLFAVAIALYVLSTWLEFKNWSSLNIRALVGMQELTRADGAPGHLLTRGAYHSVRHPRYLSAGIGVIANALFINYLGMYVIILVVFPIGMVMLAYEERELIERFGEEYRQYQRDVPQLVPSFSRPYASD